MRLNTIQPALGAKKAAKRLGRGIGSGKGKTCGRGHKGQHARAGGFHKVGFEGGQMPLQRRLPKFGFISKLAKDTEELTLTQLAKLEITDIDMMVLKTMGIIPQKTRRVKVIATGTIQRAINLAGIAVTAGAAAAITAAGGKVEA